MLARVRCYPAGLGFGRAAADRQYNRAMLELSREHGANVQVEGTRTAVPKFLADGCTRPYQQQYMVGSRRGRTCGYRYHDLREGHASGHAILHSFPAYDVD